MPGYNPRCDNCYKCSVCGGDGTVQEAKSGGNGKFYYERVTCKTCNGVGGKVGAGKHDHR
jgi:DnaJ-class molecular chaperone